MRGFVLFDACILLFIIRSTLPYSFVITLQFNFHSLDMSKSIFHLLLYFLYFVSFGFILHSILHFLSCSSGVPTMLLPQVWDHEILPRSIKIVGGGIMKHRWTFIFFPLCKLLAQGMGSLSYLLSWRELYRGLLHLPCFQCWFFWFHVVDLWQLGKICALGRNFVSKQRHDKTDVTLTPTS